jgi:hypothetical protein
MPAAAAFLMEVQTLVSTAPVDLYPRGITKEMPADLKHDAALEVMVELTSTPYFPVVGVGVPETQH